MKKTTHIFLTLMMTLFVVAGWSQSGIKGSLKDAAGEAIIGASVVANPGNQGVITDIDGNYELQLSPGKYTVTYT